MSVDGSTVEPVTSHHVTVPAAHSQFHVDDINVTSLSGMTPHLQISHQVKEHILNV